MKSKLIPTKNNLPEATLREMIRLLNQHLASAIDLGPQAKQAHWNVKGPHFFALHELFDKASEEIEGFVDDIAERAVELGGVALGTVQVVSKESRLPEYSVTLSSGREHVAELSSSLATFGGAVRSAIDRAAKAGDGHRGPVHRSVARR